MADLKLERDWQRSTQTGHRRPDVATEGITCLLHTATAVYALAEDGTCLSVSARNGMPARSENRCRGAQYVACFVPRTDDGLVGEPRIGGQALFVGRGSTGRAALLRTPPIVGIEYRDEQGDEVPPPRSRWASSDVDLAWDLEDDPRATVLGRPAVQLPS